MSWLYQGKYGEARQLFQKILDESPGLKLSDQAKLSIVDSYYMAGDYPEALSRAQNLLKERPNSEFLSLIYLKIARAHLRLAEWDEAQKILNKIAGNFSDSLEAHIAKQLLEEKQYFAVQVGSFLEGLLEAISIFL